MKIPSQLVHLAAAIELDTTYWQWTWLLKDKMRLYSDSKGKTLILLSNKKLGQPVKGASSVKTRDTVQAKRLYSKFQDFNAHSTKAYKYKDVNLKQLGFALEIIYQSDKWGDKNQRYVHIFDSKPSIYVDKPKAPKVIMISGGKMRVTSRGIEG